MSGLACWDVNGAQFEIETACPPAFPLPLIETDRIVSTGAGVEQVTALLCHLQELYYNVQNFCFSAKFYYCSMAEAVDKEKEFFGFGVECIALVYWLFYKVRGNTTFSLNNNLFFVLRLCWLDELYLGIYTIFCYVAWFRTRTW